jgi:hypothetical protein
MGKDLDELSAPNLDTHQSGLAIRLYLTGAQGYALLNCIGQKAVTILLVSILAHKRQRRAEALVEIRAVAYHSNAIMGSRPFAF